jgi:hypothetical protein
MAVNLKSIVQSNGFKIYFWPILTYFFINVTCMLLLTPFEPDSPRENLFVSLNGFIMLCLLWFLVARYRKITGNSVGKRTIVLLTILTTIGSVGAIMIFARFLNVAIF